MGRIRVRSISISKKGQGQATTELAIMGSIVILLFAYFVQKGYLANARQALEMYTFREALKQSRDQERGVTLTVVRDVMMPSFFTGLNRQRMQAAASVDLNPYKEYNPDKPQDLPMVQLLQLGEAMIRNENFIQVPPTKINVTTVSNPEGSDAWTPSSISQMITTEEPPVGYNMTNYNMTPGDILTSGTPYTYVTTITEDDTAKNITKDFSSQDAVPTIIHFASKEEIEQDYGKDETWKADTDPSKVTGVSVYEDTIPKNVTLVIRERVHRGKTTVTPH